MKFATALLATSLALLLAACGDNPPDALPTTPQANANEVPASATASVASYTQYVGSLALTETGLPLDVNKALPPTSETDTPIPVI